MSEARSAGFVLFIGSTTPTFSLQLLEGNSVPGPSVCRGSCEFSLPIDGVVRLVG
jgi:hypothetical protein